MTESQRKQWDEILALTSDMLKLAEPNSNLADLNEDIGSASQPWEKIAELEQQRLQLLNHFFSSPVDVADVEQLKKDISSIQSSDQQITEVGLKLQKDIGQSFSDMGHGRRAASIYAEHDPRNHR